MRRVARSILAFGLSATVAACGAATPSPSSTTAPTPSAIVTASPLAATPSAAPATAAGPGTVGDGPVAPGRYRSSTTGVTVEFDIAGEWEGAADIPEVGFWLAPAGIDGGLTMTHFPGEVFTDPCSPEGSEAIDRSAEAFIGWLAAHPELDAAEPVEATLAGRPAIQLDVSTVVGEECPENPRLWLWVLPTVGDFHLNEGEAARVIAADIGETTLVAVLETFDPDQQQALLDAAAPVLESMTVVE
jgi:hypothetical protein